MRKSCFVAIHGDLQVLEQERQISQTLFLSGKHGANGLSPVGIVVSNIVWNGGCSYVLGSDFSPSLSTLSWPTCGGCVFSHYLHTLSLLAFVRQSCLFNLRILHGLVYPRDTFILVCIHIKYVF